MKKNRHLLTSLFILASFWVSAQQKITYRRHFFNGYVVTSVGDTLFGRIKSQHNFDYKIRFIPDSDTLQKSIRISTSDIKTLKLNMLLLEKVEVNGKAKMLEKVAQGYYELFAYQYLRGEIAENHYILRLRDRNLDIDEDNFLPTMTELVFDCPEIKQKIIEGSYTYENLIDIFRRYNRWKEPNRRLSF